MPSRAPCVPPPVFSQETALSSIRRGDLATERLVIEAHLDQMRGKAPDSLVGTSSDVRRLLEEIHGDPFDPQLSVKCLKKRCNIRDNNISSRFRFTYGITIRHYIEQLRLEAASSLLRQLDVGIFDIALSVGYQNPQTFYQAFRKRFQCTPSDFRRHHASGMAKPGASR